jgi:aryl-alcohol dehydrogenase-like predicted oxidoreductase
VLNPLRTRRFAEEELQRTKTDAIDALGIARFAGQKRPPATQLPDVATEELRELSREGVGNFVFVSHTKKPVRAGGRYGGEQGRRNRG